MLKPRCQTLRLTPVDYLGENGGHSPVFKDTIVLQFKIIKDKSTHSEWLETALNGKPLLTTPQLNKGTAFTCEERLAFGLTGKLPVRVETLDDQVARAYRQYQSYRNELNKNIYLNGVHDSNQILFYKLVSQHMGEMIPIIYTPIVGTAVKQFSQEYRHPRGLYISYPERQYMDEILDNRSNPEIDLIVVTDGEGVLGIGDQGIGGMDIPIAKLMVYSLCGGINPTRTLPIQLDVGTNNPLLLNDPMYLGWRHERLSGAMYDDFIDQFVSTIRKKFPSVFLHWEDFGRDNARRNLERYQGQICTFNDDMQGTGVVTLAALLAAVKANGSTLHEQRIVIFGAGTAGTGIADQIAQAMQRDGMSLEQAQAQFWLIDRQGLLTKDMPQLNKYQQVYARDPQEVQGWQSADNTIPLLNVIEAVKPTILVGCSAVSGAFNQQVITTMAKYTKRPIVLPLSNPTERCEIRPEDLFAWTKGNALMATGSPFDDIQYNGRSLRIAQCNNALVFPGIGLGLTAIRATRLSDDALWAACKALSDFAPIQHDPHAPLLPSLDDARQVATQIAIAVAQQAMNEGVAQVIPVDGVEDLINYSLWEPRYLPYKKMTSV